MIALFLLAFPFSAALSKTSQGDQEIIAVLKTLDYVRGLDGDNDHVINVALVYDPENAVSVNEVEHVQMALRGMSNLKSGTIRAQAVSVKNIKGLSGVEVLFITHGMNSYFSTIRDVARERRIFSISNDIGCVHSGCCAFVLEYDGAVEVYLNETTLDAIGFDIDATFRYLAKRV